MLPPTILQASHTRAKMMLPEEVVPYATRLANALAPSARLTAAKALAEGRYCSSDSVKQVLFHAAYADPCPEVKAACIEHLCKLGYYDPAFMKYVKTACWDSSAEVRKSAEWALDKMTPKK